MNKYASQALHTYSGTLSVYKCILVAKSLQANNADPIANNNFQLLLPLYKGN